jgi:hypothetical protein
MTCGNAGAACGIEPTTYALRDLLVPVAYLRLRKAGLVGAAEPSLSSRADRRPRASSCAPNVPR